MESPSIPECATWPQSNAWHSAALSLGVMSLIVHSLGWEILQNVNSSKLRGWRGAKRKELIVLGKLQMFTKAKQTYRR